MKTRKLLLIIEALRLLITLFRRRKNEDKSSK